MYRILLQKTFKISGSSKRLIILNLLLLFFVVSCSPKIRKQISKEEESMKSSELVVVLEIDDNQSILGNKIGRIKVADNGFSYNCSYFENIQSLKSLARSHGANLVKITSHNPPDSWSTCHRIKADIYKVEEVKQYEKVIYWSEDRKLSWDDFQGIPNSEKFPEYDAITDCGFGFESSTAKLFSFERHFFVETKFQKMTSWVLPDKKREELLKHEQIHFDIAELFGRKLRKDLKNANINSASLRLAEEIFQKVHRDFEAYQKKYDQETNHGLNLLSQREWELSVGMELAKYEDFKLNYN